MSKKNGAEKIWANFSPVKSCVQKIFSKKVVSKIIRTNVTRTNVDWTFVPNVFDHLIFVNFEKSKRPNLCSSQKKDGLQVGGWVGGARAYHYWHENNATFWLHLASWDLPDCQPSWESKMEPSVAKCMTTFKWRKQTIYFSKINDNLFLFKVKIERKTLA